MVLKYYTNMGQCVKKKLLWRAVQFYIKTLEIYIFDNYEISREIWKQSGNQKDK